MTCSLISFFDKIKPQDISKRCSQLQRRLCEIGLEDYSSLLLSRCLPGYYTRLNMFPSEKQDYLTSYCLFLMGITISRLELKLHILLRLPILVPCYNNEISIFFHI